MVDEYEDSIIIPPPQFGDDHKPIPDPRTKKIQPIPAPRTKRLQPVPVPRTKINQKRRALMIKGSTKS